MLPIIENEYRKTKKEENQASQGVEMVRSQAARQEECVIFRDWFLSGTGSTETGDVQGMT